MQEITGDLFAHNENGPDAICITTNGFVNPDGANTMGRGCALEAKNRWPGIQLIAGRMIRDGGNRVHRLTHQESKLPPVIRLSHRHCDNWTHRVQPSHQVPYHLLTFPTKHHWREDSDIKLIELSARRLVEITTHCDWNSIVLPRPGCGLGNLNWEEQVKPLLAPILDDRFYVITFE